MAKVAFFQFSSCWGCHQSLLNLHLGLLPVLPELDIVYWPAVVDFKLSSLKARPDGDVDVGFCEGFIRTEHDLECAKLMRQKCKTLVSYGTCATYGSVAGLANQFTKEELLKRKFEECESLGEPNDMLNNRDPELTEICDAVRTVPQVVPIDIVMPGCPPKKENILGAVSALLTQSASPMDKSTNVCATCKADPCILVDGKLCWGNVTAGGCTLMCPEKGDACVGCFQSTDVIDEEKAEMQKGLLAKLGNASKEDCNLISQFISLYSGLPAQGSIYLSGDPLRKIAKGEKLELADDVQGASLKVLSKSKNYAFTKANVCAQCDRNGNRSKKMTSMKRWYEGTIDPELCFLNQGFVCMGPVTAAGCGTQCPNNGNSICNGCYGPVFGVAEQGARGISTIASVADLSPDVVNDQLPDVIGQFYRYTLPVSDISEHVEDKELKEDD
jgi:F420-non-reducing hydrogenase small subunit